MSCTHNELWLSYAQNMKEMLMEVDGVGKGEAFGIPAARGPQGYVLILAMIICFTWNLKCCQTTNKHLSVSVDNWFLFIKFPKFEKDCI